MNLQGRILSLEMRPPTGDDVRLLHTELRQLGLLIPDAEVREAVFGEGTRQAVMTFQGRKELQATGVVDTRTATLINTEVARRQPRVVRGQVRRMDGGPAVGILVRAYDKDFRTEEKLGEAQTDSEGRYEITYTAEKFRRAEKGSADLLVTLSNNGGKEISPNGIIFNGQPIETVDLILPGPAPSEYEQLENELTPLIGEVKLHELTEDDITFLAGDTGQDPQRIAWLSMSTKLAQERKLSGDNGARIPAPVFYAWFRQGFPTHVSGLLAQDRNQLRSALERSFDENIIPANLKSSIDAHLDLFRRAD